MTVRSVREATLTAGQDQISSVAIEISDWPVADGRRPRRRLAAITSPEQSCHARYRSCHRDDTPLPACL